MINKNILIGAGVVVVGYLLWKKSQSNITKADVPLTLNIDVNTIPDSFIIKGDGYNTTYSKGSAPLGNTSIMTYSKISGRTDGSIGMGSPIAITANEFKNAYNNNYER